MTDRRLPHLTIWRPAIEERFGACSRTFEDEDEHEQEQEQDTRPLPILCDESK